MNELNLAPWEVISESIERRGQSEFNAVIERNGKQSEILMRWANVGGPHMAFVREVESTGEANWVVFDSESSHLKMANADLDIGFTELEGIVEEISSGEYSLGRLILSAIDFTQTGNTVVIPIVLTSPKGGFVSDSKNNRKAVFSLSSPLSDEDFKEGNSELKEIVLSEFLNKGSDLYFASLWVCIGKKGRIERLVGAQIRKEVEGIMHSALICEADLWLSDKTWEWSTGFVESSWLCAPSADDAISDKSEEVESQLLLPVVEKCLADYLVQKSAPLRAQHLCANASWIEGDVELEVTVSEPTNHEKTEAALKLREWLSSRLPEAKINALLSPPELH